MTYLTRTVNAWFARVVYERDSWDEWLDSLGQTMGGSEVLLLWLTRLFVWFTRAVLWCLMIVGHAVAGYMLRQMEFDADRHEARFAGSEVFAQTAERLHQLGFAHEEAMSDLSRFYDEGRLSNDLTGLLMRRVEKLSVEDLKGIEEFAAAEKTHWADTHPCHTDRIVNARREATEGVFQLEIPATELFVDFAATSEQITLRFYHEVLGDQMRNDRVQSNADLEQQLGEENSAYEALTRAARGLYHPLKEFQIEDLAFEPIEPSVAKMRLHALRKAVLRSADDYRPAWEKLSDVLSNQSDVEVAASLHRAGVEVPANAFENQLSTMMDVEIVRDYCERHLKENDELRKPLQTYFAERLRTGLSLACSGTISLPKQTLQRIATLEHRIKVLKQIDEVMPLVHKLTGLSGQFGLELNLNVAIQEAYSGHQTYLNQLRALGNELLDLVGEVHRRLRMIDYPFDHADNGISVGDYCFESVCLQVEQALGAAECLQSVYHLRARLVGSLCQIVEEVESELGLPGWPDVEDEASRNDERVANVDCKEDEPAGEELAQEKELVLA